MKSLAARRWFRLHRSTLVVALIFCCGLAFLNWPGEDTGLVRAHGWPFTYVIRSSPMPAGGGCYAINVPSIWNITSDVHLFRPVWLLLNALIIGALTATVAALIEWWRRRCGSLLRFTFRGAAIGMLVCCACLAWVHYRVARVQQQQPAIARITAVGGSVQYESLLPDWLRSLLSDDIGRPFDEPLMVNLAYTSATDDDLAALELLPTIEHLDLGSTQVTSAGLAHIRHLDLVWLSLDQTHIDDAGMVHLQDMQRLRTLSCEETAFGDAGIEEICKVRSLEGLSLRSTRITDAGLRRLRALSKLCFIYADRCAISEAAANELRETAPNLYMITHAPPPLDDPFGP